MTNNDVFKKLRVALMLRDDEIIEILKLVDFNIGKSELGAFFRKEDHPNYMECGDQVLRNFLNGLVVHLRGTKENPKHPGEVLSQKVWKSKSDKSAPRQNHGTNHKSEGHKNSGGKKNYKAQDSSKAKKSDVPKNSKTKQKVKAQKLSFKEQQRQRMDTDITPVKYKNKPKDRK